MIQRGGAATSGGGGGALNPSSLRLQRDWTELQNEKDSERCYEISFPKKEDQTNFIVKMKRTEGLWKDVSIEFEVDVPIAGSKTYPFVPPKVKCLTMLYHPNITSDGKVCLNILRDTGWTAAMSLSTLMDGLQVLFTAPEPNDPLNQEAGRVYREDFELFKRNVQKSLMGGIVDGVKYNKLV